MSLGLIIGYNQITDLIINLLIFIAIVYAGLKLGVTYLKIPTLWKSFLVMTVSSGLSLLFYVVFFGLIMIIGGSMFMLLLGGSMAP